MDDTIILVGRGGVGQQVLHSFWLEGVLANRFCNYFGWRGCWPMGLISFVGWRGCWPIGFTIILVGGAVGQ